MNVSGRYIPSFCIHRPVLISVQEDETVKICDVPANNVVDPLWDDLTPLVGHRINPVHNMLSRMYEHLKAKFTVSDHQFLEENMPVLMALVLPDLPGLTQSETAALTELLDSYKAQGLFSKDETDLGELSPEFAAKYPFRIRVDKDFNHCISPYRLSQTEQEWFDKLIPKLLELGIIEPALDEESNPSPYASSPWIVPKKEPGAFRFTTDFRVLNKHTVRDAFPLPSPETCLNSFAGAEYFSALDLTSGYWQVPIDPGSRQYTAFRTGGQRNHHGHYQYKRLPMGLTNSCAHFQRIMQAILLEECADFVVIYLDDIIVYSSTFKEHLEHLNTVFKLLLKAGLKLRECKCSFAAAAIKYLGHIVSRRGTHTDPAKTQGIRAFPVPTDPKGVKSFLGMAGYYSHFIKDYATLTAPLHRITGTKSVFQWTPVEQKAFDDVKAALVDTPVLRQPDFTKPFTLHTDWSTTAVGAVLGQQDGKGNHYAVAFASRLCTTAERNYPSQKGECMALIWAIQKYRPYLHGRKFTVFSDHFSLQWLMSSQLSSAQIWRWVMQLQAYDFEVKYITGPSNVVADALSRYAPVMADDEQYLSQEWYLGGQA